MSLGVLNNIAAIYAQNNLNNTQNSLQNTLTQLSSGSRINSGADDAAGLAVADGLHANEAALTQSAQNAENGIGLLQTADGALSQVTSLLNRAVTLSTESANGTLTSTQSSSANQEYQNILAQIAAIGSTTNFNSNNVFSNSARTIFVSDGTASGANVYSNVVGNLRSNSVGETAAVGAATLISGGTTNAASAAIVQSTTSATASNPAANLGGNISIGFVGGAAPLVFTEASPVSGTQFATDLTTFYQAHSLSITASYNSGTGVLSINGPADGSQTLTIGSDGITVSAGTIGTIAAGPVATAGVPGKGIVTFALPAVNDTFSGVLSVSAGSGSLNVLNVAAGTTGTALAAQINNNAAYQAAQLSASYNTGTGVLTISGPGGTGNNVAITNTVLNGVAPPLAGAAAGAGIDFTQATVSTLNNTTAQSILVAATSAIADVAYQRGIIGANINQLTAAAGVASAESVNLTAAENVIRSTNYGQATSDLAKFKVLSETGISALAQANAVQQEVTKLLQ